MFWSVFVGLCAKREVSPNAVAKALGLSSGSVTLWKNGAVPRSTTIRKIADYFGVSPESFLAEADDLAIKKPPIRRLRGSCRLWRTGKRRWKAGRMTRFLKPCRSLWRFSRGGAAMGVELTRSAKKALAALYTHYCQRIS